MLAMGAAAAVLGVATLGAGISLHRPALMRFARRYVVIVLLATLGAFAVMESALFAHDFSLRFVADNVARATPGLYTFTAAWSALEGSILLWALALSGYVAFTTWHFRHRAEDPVVAWATLVQLLVLGFFFVLMLFPANPFRVLHGAVPADGQGPNPLLQNNPLVVIHPPILYAGYVGFTIPFSFAVAALVTGRFGEGWLADVRRTTLVAFGFLTAGILLGALWSYAVLGWGGYWGWDPVENASLLPWLTATAFIHSVMVQERRGMLRVWNLSLVIATFCLTILGTFLTRSGVLNSVHAFSNSPIGPWLLTFLGVCAAAGVGLIAWRGDALRAPGRIDSPMSREAAFLLNNLLFAAFALVVLTGTVFPLLVQALQNKQITVGEPYFDRMGVPIGLALLFLMAIGPVLPWRAASVETLRKRLLVPAWIGGSTLVACVLGGARGVADVIAFALAAFVLASVSRSVWKGISARRRATRESLRATVVGAVRGNPRLYGGLLVHAGVVVVAVALATTSGYTTRREVQLTPGQSATVRGFTVTYLGTRQVRSAQRATVEAQLRVRRGSSDLGVLRPAISSYPNFPDGIGTPAIHTDPWHDLYLTHVSAPTAGAGGGAITIGLQVGTFVMWLWIGGAIMTLGVLLALTPTRRRRMVVHAPGEQVPARELAEAST